MSLFIRLPPTLSLYLFVTHTHILTYTHMPNHMIHSKSFLYTSISIYCLALSLVLWMCVRGIRWVCLNSVAGLNCRYPSGHMFIYLNPFIYTLTVLWFDFETMLRALYKVLTAHPFSINAKTHSHMWIYCSLTKYGIWFLEWRDIARHFVHLSFEGNVATSVRCWLKSFSSISILWLITEIIDFSKTIWALSLNRGGRKFWWHPAPALKHYLGFCWHKYQFN